MANPRRRGGPRKIMPLDVRVARRTGPPDARGCTPWIGAKNAKGYGTTMVTTAFREKRAMLAHRLAWLAAKGSVPPGFCVCHRCDNPSCVNVDHLFLGTNEENHADMIAKGRGRESHRGEDAPSAKLSDADAREIHRLAANGERRRVIAERFAVSVATVNLIAKARAWKHLGLEPVPRMTNWDRRGDKNPNYKVPAAEVVARREAGMSIAALAKELGVSHSAIVRATARHRHPSSRSA